MDQIKYRGKANAPHKAKFLTEIEKTLTSKIISLKNNNSTLLSDKLLYTDTVLKIHKEAFDSLLENMTTFKYILIEIRKSYENSIQIRDKIIAQNNSLMRAMSSDKKRKNALCEEVDLYKNKIKDLEGDINFIKKKNCKLEKESFSNYQALSAEKEARYALLIENVKLRKENVKLSNDASTEKPKDIVVLQLALNQSRKDLKDVIQKYNMTLEEYSETIPKNTYEALESEYFELKKKCLDMSKEFNELNIKYQNTIYEQKSSHEKIHELKEKLSELEISGTPRPEWDICSEIIGGGVDRWNKLTENLSSMQKLEFILNEIGPSVKKDNDTYFEGLGYDPVIPEYLRHSGQVRNLKLSRREINVIINDIWKSKANEKKTSLQDFMKKYIEKICDDSISGVEMAYNLYNSCQRSLDDERIKLFWGVLNGTLSQDIYYSFKNEWITLKNSMMNILKHDQRTLHLNDFEKNLKLLFPFKSDVDIQNIVKISKKQLKLKPESFDVDIQKLFMENEEGFDHSDLSKELFRQRQISQEKYVREIVAQLGGKKNLNKLISVEMLKRAFAMIDPHIDHLMMESNVRWAFSDKSTNLKMIYPITLKTLTAKLLTGNIQRVGPKHKNKSAKTR